MKKRRRLLDSRGATLVEVMVTFVLIGMFLLSAVTAVTAGMNAFYRMQETTRAITVCDTILDKIEGELSPAMADDARLDLGGLDGGEGWWDTISFYTGNGSPVYMTSAAGADGKKIFQMYYYGMKGLGNGEGTLWTFDSGMYQGFWVKKLLFRWLGSREKPNNVIEVSLELENGSITYSETRYVQCTNFFRASHFSEIRTGVDISLTDPDY